MGHAGSCNAIMDVLHAGSNALMQAFVVSLGWRHSVSCFLQRQQTKIRIDRLALAVGALEVAKKILAVVAWYEKWLSASVISSESMSLTHITLCSALTGCLRTSELHVPQIRMLRTCTRSHQHDMRRSRARRKKLPCIVHEIFVLDFRDHALKCGTRSGS